MAQDWNRFTEISLVSLYVLANLWIFMPPCIAQVWLQRKSLGQLPARQLLAIASNFRPLFFSATLESGNGNAWNFQPRFLCSPECTGLLPRGFGSWQTKCAPLGLKFEPHCLTGIFDVLWMPHTPNSPVFHCHGNPQPYRFDIWVELACSSGSTHNLGFESARLEVYWLIAGPAPTLTPGCN